MTADPRFEKIVFAIQSDTGAGAHGLARKILKALDSDPATATRGRPNYFLDEVDDDPRLEALLTLFRNGARARDNRALAVAILERLDREFPAYPVGAFLRQTDEQRRENILRALNSLTVARDWSLANAQTVLDHLDDPPEPPSHLVKIAFQYFDHPKDAARWTGKTYTYAAAESLNLAIGDRVVVPAQFSRTATVAGYTDVQPPYGPSWIERRA